MQLDDTASFTGKIVGKFGCVETNVGETAHAENADKDALHMKAPQRTRS